MADVTFDASVRDDDWAWVPLGFPDDRWASAAAWSEAVGDALAGDVVDDRERWRAIAAAVVALPTPSADVVGRVWHVAPGTGTLLVGHVRVARDDPGVQPGELALAGLRAGALQRLLDVEHPHLGSAFRSVAVGETESGAMLGVHRWSGVAQRARVTLEATHPELQRLALAESAFDALFASMGIGDH